jgi:hypothetical protein
VAAQGASVKGCITRTGGSHRLRIRTIRAQSTLVFWLRRRSAFSQYRVTWFQRMSAVQDREAIRDLGRPGQQPAARGLIGGG